MSGFRAAVSILRSFDEAAAKAFYLDFLSFELLFEHRFTVESPLYFGVRCDECILHLSEHFGDGTPGSIIRIEVPDVQLYCQQLNEKNYTFSKPGISSQEWSFDEMAIADPSSNKLVFCTPHER